jgi:hypothetical protein
MESDFEMSNFFRAYDRVTRLDEFSPLGRIVTLEAFFENYRSSQNHWATVSRGKNYVIIMTKNGLGYILADFFSQLHLVTLVPMTCPRLHRDIAYV